MLKSILLLASLLFTLVECCYIQGTDSGVCSSDPMDPMWRLTRMPYCGRFVYYPTCLPKEQKIPATRQFPAGRWFNHTVDTKDAWVGTETEKFIMLRRDHELNRSLHNLGINEYGDPGAIISRFYHKVDCMNAYRAYMCWINFPRCDPVTEESLPTCRSACENFFISCRYEKDLWRCGKSKFFNGYSREAPSGYDNKTGSPIYLRDYFPGQPFRQNKFNKDGNPVAICTPSIKGAASSMHHSSICCRFILPVLTGLLLLLFSF